MNTPWITTAAIISLGGLFVLLPLVAHTFQRYRHKRVVKCPETRGLAEVDVDAPRAAFSSAFGKPLLRIKNCTLWPKRKGCEQGCLRQ
jgi:hypothetical protein